MLQFHDGSALELWSSCKAALASLTPQRPIDLDLELYFTQA